MAIRFTRRALMKTAGALTASAGLPALSGRALAQEAESHGLSTFGELALPPDFPHFAYVNPKAPKGGTLTIQIKRARASTLSTRSTPSCCRAMARRAWMPASTA
jgi:microcin C transport system substrate-binding protein